MNRSHATYQTETPTPAQPLCTGYYGVDQLSVDPAVALSGSWFDLTEDGIRALVTSGEFDTITINHCGGWLLLNRVVDDSYGTAEYCIDSVCSTFSNIAPALDVRTLGIYSPELTPVAVTITNGADRLGIESLQILDNPEATPIVLYVPVVATPHTEAYEYITISGENGEPVTYRYDRAGSTTDAFMIALLTGIFAVLVLALGMALLWRK